MGAAQKATTLSPGSPTGTDVLADQNRCIVPLLVTGHCLRRHHEAIGIKTGDGSDL